MQLRLHELAHRLLCRTLPEADQEAHLECSGHPAISRIESGQHGTSSLGQLLLSETELHTAADHDPRDLLVSFAYRVTSVRAYPKSELPTSVFRRTGPPRLVLVTCGGPFDAATGHYPDDVVVTAAPRTRP
jgi:hypothetical protein